ncbi:ISU1, partial [Symbiodinium necroappetens]
MHHEEPDEILITPPAQLWSPALEASLATDARGWARLCSHRQRDHDEILVFCALIYEVQRRGKRHAHLEHPWTSRAWKTKALSRLPGHATYVDQCMYGLTSKDAAGRVYPVKKPTCYMTTKRSLCEQAGCKCQGEHQHGPEPPDDRHLSDDPTTQLANTLAELIVRDGPADYVLPVDEADQDVEMAAADDKDDQDKTEEIKVNEELKQQVGRQAYSYVARLHKNLGHPSPNVLARMLEEVQDTENVITCAKHYLCAGCLKRKKPAGVPPASGLNAREFNERLMLDSAWIDTSDGRMCVLTIMCQATRFVTIRVLGSEQSKELLKGLERAWIKHFGVPKIIRIDEAKGWSATLIREWCSDHGVELEIAPGAVERRHQVVRRSLERYMDDRQDRSKHGLREAAIFVPGQINLLSSVRGFSPAQWVLGKTPANSFSLTGEIFNPAAPDDDDDVGAFASNQKRRTAAQVAFLKADTDLRLRRAMNRNYRETDQAVPRVGQKVFFWRIQGAGILQKNRWRGPARVVAIETDDHGTEWVIWLTHGTSLLRCAPHQVRPVIAETGYNVAADPAAALEVLQELKARSTTQFKDITVNEPLLEDNLGLLSDGIPSEFAPTDHPSDADSEPVEPPPPVPGVVELAFQDVLSRQRPPTRRISTVEPAGAAASARDTPLPDQDDDDDDLFVDAYVVDTFDNNLPEGWTVIEGELGIDEAWLARVEAKEKSMTVQQRAQMMEAKRAELESYFKNQVWQFAEDGE